MGMLNAQEYEEIRHKVLYNMSRLGIKDLDWSIGDGDELLLIAPHLAKINPVTFQRLSEAKEIKYFAKDQIIFEKKRPVDGMYIVAKGVVEDKVTADISIRYGMGSHLNYIQVVTPENRALTTLRAVNKTKVYFIPKKVYQEIFETDIDFRNYCHFQALRYFFKIYPPTNMPFQLEDFHI